MRQKRLKDEKFIRAKREGKDGSARALRPLGEDDPILDVDAQEESDDDGGADYETLATAGDDAFNTGKFRDQAKLRRADVTAMVTSASLALGICVNKAPSIGDKTSNVAPVSAMTDLPLIIIAGAATGIARSISKSSCRILPPNRLLVQIMNQWNTI